MKKMERKKKSNLIIRLKELEEQTKKCAKSLKTEWGNKRMKIIFRLEKKNTREKRKENVNNGALGVMRN